MAASATTEALSNEDIVQQILTQSLDLRVLCSAARVNVLWHGVALGMRGWRVLLPVKGRGSDNRIRRNAIQQVARMVLLPDGEVAYVFSRLDGPHLSLLYNSSGQVVRLTLRQTTDVLDVRKATTDTINKLLFVVCEAPDDSFVLLRISLPESRELDRCALPSEPEAPPAVSESFVAVICGALRNQPTSKICVLRTRPSLSHLFTIDMHDRCMSLGCYRQADLQSEAVSKQLSEYIGIRPSRNGPESVALDATLAFHPLPLLYAVDKLRHCVCVLELRRRSAHAIRTIGRGSTEARQVWWAPNTSEVLMVPFDHNPSLFFDPHHIALTQKHLIVLDHPEAGPRVNILSRALAEAETPLQRIRLGRIDGAADWYIDYINTALLVAGTRVVVASRFRGSLDMFEVIREPPREDVDGLAERAARADDALILGGSLPRHLLPGHGSVYLAHLEEVLHHEEDWQDQDDRMEAWDALVRLISPYTGVGCGITYLRTTLVWPEDMEHPHGYDNALP